MFIFIQTTNNSDINSRLWTLGPTMKVNDIKILLKITSEGGKIKVLKRRNISIQTWKETENNGILPINNFRFQSIFH